MNIAERAREKSWQAYIQTDTTLTPRIDAKVGFGRFSGKHPRTVSSESMYNLIV